MALLAADQNQQAADIVVDDEETVTDGTSQEDGKGKGSGVVTEGETKLGDAPLQKPVPKRLFSRRHSLERQHVVDTLPSIIDQDVVRLCVSLTGTGGTFKSVVISSHQVRLVGFRKTSEDFCV